mgnify:CR=1 FL=1
MEFIKVNEIKPHPENPRDHDDEQIQKIADSIERLGWGRPIILSKDNYILAGHGAYIAATEKLHLKEVPFVRMKHLHDSPEAKAYMIADNKLTDESEWNYGKLEPIFEELELEGFDLQLTGFEDKELREVENKLEGHQEVEEDNFDEEVTESMCQPGDIWQLGKHRLMCGDSTNTDDVKVLVDNNKVDMVFTDPPYDFDKDKEIAVQLDKITENSHIFVMHDDRGIINYLRASQFEFDRFFVLDTKICSPRGNDPYLRHILVSHERKGQPMKHENKYDGLSSIIPIEYRKNIKEERLHDHQKTVKDVSKFITHYSHKKQNILDLFGGSGTTLIASEQLERNCFMMELNPHFCDIIIKRFEDFTGKKAEKI